MYICIVNLPHVCKNIARLSRPAAIGSAFSIWVPVNAVRLRARSTAEVTSVQWLQSSFFQIRRLHTELNSLPFPAYLAITKPSCHPSEVDKMKSISTWKLKTRADEMIACLLMTLYEFITLNFNYLTAIQNMRQSAGCYCFIVWFSFVAVMAYVLRSQRPVSKKLD